VSGQIVYRKPVKARKPPPPPPHECWVDRPAASRHSPGDIWLCECGRKWRRGDLDGRAMWKRHLRPLWFKKHGDGWQK
jgi:hypothetical protein